MKSLHSNRPSSSNTTTTDGPLQSSGLEMFESFYRDNPYRVLGAAAAVGYVAAGGLATPFTRRLIRIGMKALFVPIAATQLKEIALGSSNENHPLDNTDRNQ